MLNQIIYSSNDKWFDGLYLSILSILRRSKSEYCFNILTANLQQINKNYTPISESHIAELYKLIKAFNSKNELKIFNCTKMYTDIFGNLDDRAYTPYSLFKLFIPNYINDNSNALYLDVDTMANNDISIIFDINLKSKPICVAHDFKHQYLKLPNNNFFNTGVMLLNIANIKQNNLFNKVIDYIKINHLSNDMESINNIFNDNFMFFPHNDYWFNWQYPSLDQKAIIFHFAYTGSTYNIKQWDVIGLKEILKINAFDEDLKYFYDQKKLWVKEINEINILYACNDQMFDGLLLSILSILSRTKKVHLNFYVLTADLSHINNKYVALSDEHIYILKEVIKAFNPLNTFNILDCKSKYCKTFGTNKDQPRFTPYALFRLFADQFEELSGLVLYLDIDTLANGDISEAFSVDMDFYEICVCSDYWLMQNKKTDRLIFNSGVMLINIDFIRQTKYFEKAIKYIVDNNPKMADQQALYCTWHRIKTWKNEYKFNYQKLGIESDTIIKHFNTTISNATDKKVIKPWNVQEVQEILKLHNWDNDYEMFNKIKSIFKLSK